MLLELLQDEPLHCVLAHHFADLLLRELYARLQEVAEDILIGLAAHGVLVDEGVYNLLDVHALEAVLGQLDDVLAYLEDLVVQVVWNLLAKDHEELEEEVAEDFVLVDVLRSDVDEDELEEVEHVERGRALLAHLLDLLQVRENDLDEVYLNPGSCGALLGDELQQAPDLLEEPEHVPRSHCVAEPVDQRLNQLDYASLNDEGGRHFDEALVVINE